MKLCNTQSKIVLVILSIYIYLYLYHKFLSKKLYILDFILHLRFSRVLSFQVSLVHLQ